MIREAIKKVVLGQGLDEREMEAATGRIIDGKVPASQVGALLTALRMKGESVDEITGAARALKARLFRFQLNNHLLNLDRDDINFEEETILEVSDTGVNGTQIFNVSAATTFVVAGSGRRIARYGNKMSSRFLGTADVLELTETIARVVRRLNGKNALVIFGEETCDELSLCGITKVSQLREGEIDTFDIRPEDFGFQPVGPETLKGGTVNENAAIVMGILSGDKGPRRDMVLLNAGAALWAAGKADSLAAGIRRSADIIDAGQARAKLEDLIAFTNQCAAYDREASIFQYGSDMETASSF